MEETLLNAAIQLPIVGLFVWFILKFWDRINEMMEKRDVAFLKALADERDHRKEMMDQERQSRSDMAERFAETMDELNNHLVRIDTKVDGLGRLFTEHDTRTEQFIAARNAESNAA